MIPTEEIPIALTIKRKYEVRLASFKDSDNPNQLRVTHMYEVCSKSIAIFVFFQNFLFIHVPFKVIPTRYYTLVPTFFPVLKALQKIIFCDLVQLLLRCRLYLLNRSVASSFHRPLQFREQEKVTEGQIWGIRWLQH